eukprot:CAMPEP_0180172558 /NCGR_PEP_ID=MMETSP0986-20121125/35095_1 /TAXON_ID=697907 /ORGANISM="non described non described, Strain CCMP2293" /LENGTH=63 /DNA_ID=CAMNT_0022124665 /DNA_START=74 /DNA_END=262 /DNA_ORIENTATION=-
MRFGCGAFSKSFEGVPRLRKIESLATERCILLAARLSAVPSDSSPEEGNVSSAGRGDPRFLLL